MWNLTLGHCNVHVKNDIMYVKFGIHYVENDIQLCVADCPALEMSNAYLAFMVASGATD